MGTGALPVTGIAVDGGIPEAGVAGGSIPATLSACERVPRGEERSGKWLDGFAEARRDGGRVRGAGRRRAARPRCDGAPDSALPIEFILRRTTYRFPVLAHWSFTCTGAGSFRTLMQGSDVGLLGTLPAGGSAPAAPGLRATAGW